MIKLTPKQWEVLESLGKGSLLLVYHQPGLSPQVTNPGSGRWESAWRPAVDALLLNRLVETTQNSFTGITYGISDAGRAALAARKAALAKRGA